MPCTTRRFDIVLHYYFALLENCLQAFGVPEPMSASQGSTETLQDGQGTMVSAMNIPGTGLQKIRRKGLAVRMEQTLIIGFNVY